MQWRWYKFSMNALLKKSVMNNKDIRFIMLVRWLQQQKRTMQIVIMNNNSKTANNILQFSKYSNDKEHYSLRSNSKQPRESANSRFDWIEY